MKVNHVTPVGNIATRPFAVILSLALCLQCAGVGYTWKPNAADPDGILTNTVHYYNGSTAFDPETMTIAPGDTVNFTMANVSSDQLVLTLPSNDVVSTAYGVQIIPKSGGTLKLDLPGAVWRQPNVESGTYPAWSKFVICDKNTTGLFQFYDAYTTNGSFMLSNVVFRLANDTSGNVAFDLDRGLIDCFSPNGVNLTGGTIYAFAINANMNSGKMSFHAGSCLRTPKFLVYAQVPSNELVFDGGDGHYISNLQIRNSSSLDETVDRTKVLLTGSGTKLTIGGNFDYAGTGSAPRGHRYRVSVKDGSTLSVAGAIYQIPAANRPAGVNDTFEVLNGGTLKLGKTDTTFYWGNACVVASNSVIDSTATGEKAVVLTGIATALLKDSEWRCTSLHVQPGTSARMQGGGLELQGNLRIAHEATSTATELVLEDGTYSVMGGVAIAYGNNSIGTLVLSNAAVASVYSITGGKDSTACLHADGGTLRAKAASDSFVAAVDEAACGAGGLTIDSDYNLTIAQNFSDLDGAAGELIFTGSGTKTFSGNATTVSRIVVAGGTLNFAASARASSVLVVTNGASVAFAGDPSDVGLKGLVVGDGSTAGVIALSAGQTLAVDGDVVVENAKLSLDGDFALGTTNVLLTATGNVSESSAVAWADALITAGSNSANSYEFSTEGTEGGVSFKMAVRESALEIVQESGSREYQDAIAFGKNENVFVAVSNDAVLTVSGKVAKGGLTKVGGGKFYLTNTENMFFGGIFSAAGLFSVPAVASLGSVLDGVNTFTLGGGTLEFTSGSAQSYQGKIVIDAGLKKAAVVKTDGDVTVAGLSVTSGDLVKRGAGRLVVEPPSGTTWTISADNGGSSTYGGDPATIDADISDDGAAPTTGYTGLNVVEGELVLKGDAGTVFNCPHSVLVGLKTANGTVQPALTVDGATASFQYNGSFGLGSYQNNSTFTRTPRFTIRNGASVKVGDFVAGRGMTDGTFSGYEYPTTTVENATVQFATFRGGNWYKTRHALVATNSYIYCEYFSAYGPNYLDIADSVMQKNANGDCFTAKFNGSSGGSWLFRNGTRLSLFKFDPSASFTDNANGLTMTFNDAVWETGGGAYPTFHIYKAGSFTFRAEGAGLTLPVADGNTVNVARAISGPGNIVKTGGGDLVFETQGTWDSAITTKTSLDDPVSLAITGLLDVREGAVSVETGACRTGGVYRTASGTSISFGGNALGPASFAGDGSFFGFSASGATIASDGEGVAVPQFSSATFSGVTRVDFGCTEEAPFGWHGVKDLPVARFTGESPDVTRWKVSGIGEKCIGGKFSVVDGEVRVTLVCRGLAISFM